MFFNKAIKFHFIDHCGKHDQLFFLDFGSPINSGKKIELLIMSSKSKFFINFELLFYMSDVLPSLDLNYSIRIWQILNYYLVESRRGFSAGGQ